MHGRDLRFDAGCLILDMGCLIVYSTLEESKVICLDAGCLILDK